MNMTNTVLDRVAAVRGISSDYALAKALSITRGAVSNYRRGRTGMDEAVAIRAAEILGDIPEALMAEFQAERCKSAGVRSAYLTLAKMARGDFSDAARRRAIVSGLTI